METIIKLKNKAELEKNKSKIEKIKKLIGNNIKIIYKKPDIIDKLLKSPKQALKFKPLKREDIYEK